VDLVPINADTITPRKFAANVDGDKLVYVNNENKRIVRTTEIAPQETIAFSKLAMRWESFYSFTPEYYGVGRNNELVSFLNGKLYRHEKNTLYNNFYGIQFTRMIEFISNAGSSLQKVWLHLSTESTHPFRFRNIETLEGQQSELDIQDFKLIENVYYADFLRDKNTPNVNIPLLFGDDLRSSSLRLLAEDIETGLSIIYALNTYFITSESTNK
jgi:DNA-binding beta-propeller fold protein YncE